MRMSTVLPAGAAMLCLLALPVGAPARAAEVKNLDAPIAAGSKLSYRQLVKKVFPGAKDAGPGRMEVADTKLLRRPGTRERTQVDEGMLLTAFDARWVRGDGRRNLLLSWSAVEAANKDDTALDTPFVVAVIPEGMSEPQDVADLKLDRFMSLSDKLLALGPDDGFIVSGRHHNAGQGYLLEGLFHIRDGRLHRIDEIFALNVSAGCVNTFTEAVNWRTEPDAAAPYPRIVATVTRQVGPDPEDHCPGKSAHRKAETYTGSWRWDGARKAYAVENDAELKRLAAINEKNL